MVAVREKQHADKLPEILGYGMKLLPVAAIYGGNSSGKTNISTALNFVKHPIVVGPLPESLIPTEPFWFDPMCASLPSRFRFEFLISDKWYKYVPQRALHEIDAELKQVDIKIAGLLGEVTE